MTMPVKIWASEAKDGYGEWQDAQNGMPSPIQYIRADIAEELAQALELAYSYGWMPAGDALEEYKEATK